MLFSQDWGRMPRVYYDKDTNEGNISYKNFRQMCCVEGCPAIKVYPLLAILSYFFPRILSDNLPKVRQTLQGSEHTLPGAQCSEHDGSSHAGTYTPPIGLRSYDRCDILQASWSSARYPHEAPKWCVRIRSTRFRDSIRDGSCSC